MNRGGATNPRLLPMPSPRALYVGWAIISPTLEGDAAIDKAHESPNHGPLISTQHIGYAKTPHPIGCPVARQWGHIRQPKPRNGSLSLTQALFHFRHLL